VSNSSSDASLRRCRDTSQQTGTAPLSHSTDVIRQASPRVKSEHLSPPMSRDRVVTSRGTSPLDVTSLSAGEGASPRAPASSSQLDRCDSDTTTGRTTDTNTGRTAVTCEPCRSNLGYEIECITPVSEEAAGDDDDGLSRLDVLSCVASSQLDQTRRRFSILDLPLSEFIDAAAAADDDGRKSSTSPDVISAGYNVPSVTDCVSESMSRVIHQQTSVSDASTEQRTGDVFTALRVDVGQ